MLWLGLAGLAVVGGSVATIAALAGDSGGVADQPLDAGSIATESPALDAAAAAVPSAVDAAQAADMVVIEVTDGAEIRERSRGGPLVAKTRYQLARPRPGERVVLWVSKRGHTDESLVVTNTSQSPLEVELEPKRRTASTAKVAPKPGPKPDAKPDRKPDPGATR